MRCPSPLPCSIFSNVLTLFPVPPQHLLPRLPTPPRGPRPQSRHGLACRDVTGREEGSRQGGRALQAVDLAELASAHDRPLEVFPIGRLEIEGAVVLLRVAVEGAEHVVAPARDARVAHLMSVRAVSPTATKSKLFFTSSAERLRVGCATHVSATQRRRLACATCFHL